MMKHSLSLLVAMTTLAGCQLYFGEENDSSGSWTYCGQDGYYECTDEDCYWRGPECPSGMTPGEQPGGFECKESTDCAAGCYCGNGICEEAGFCTQDSDCGNGYTCNEARSSCEPIGTEPEVSCVTDYDCAIGSYCNPDTLKCDETCTCASNAEAANQGYNYCDEDRTTCLPGIDPAGDCTGEVTCNLGRPTCPEGSVATISPFTSCYTGECQAINTCGTAPGCEAFTNESDCAGASTCSLSYTGINCRNPNNNNAPCSAGTTSCVCDSYQFASCTDAP